MSKSRKTSTPRKPLTLQAVRRIQSNADRSGDPKQLAFKQRIQRAYAKQQQSKPQPS